MNVPGNVITNSTSRASSAVSVLWSKPVGMRFQRAYSGLLNRIAVLPLRTTNSSMAPLSRSISVRSTESWKFMLVPVNVQGDSACGVLGLIGRYLGQPKPFPQIGSRTSLHEDSRSNEFFRWLRERDQECGRTHAICHMSAPTSLPKRVLDVGSSPSNTVRIIETARTSGSYTTLSHCWGLDANPETRTLKDNIEARYVGFDMGLLPKTFRDAIIATRQLGIQYVWIDSLCIIQDDKCVHKILDGR
jgi:hypothetical protein